METDPQQTPSVSDRPEAEVALNYEALRRAGIAHLERLGPALWTDFNSHDPGITLLEALCFALTDLGYRSTLPIADLVTPAPDPGPEPEPEPEPEPLPSPAPGGPVEDPETRIAVDRPGAFYSAHEVLNSAPVTAADLRKLIIDRVPEVINVWLSPYQHRHHVACASGEQSLQPLDDAPGELASYTLGGLWQLLLDLQPGLSGSDTDEVIERVQRLYHANRNLGEDLQRIGTVASQGVLLCTDIALQPEADLNRVAAEVIHRVEQYLSPPVPRHTLADLQARDIPIDTIYEGPILRHGFILDDELEAAGLRGEVCRGELTALIMGIPGVATVRDLQLNYADPELRLGETQFPADGCLLIAAGSKPVLDVAQSVFHYFKDLLPFTEDPARVAAELQRLRAAAAAAAISTDDRPLPGGHYRDIAGHLSVQQELPQVYGLAPHGLPLSADRERRAQAAQLQGYLLLFDQLLANYLGQLRHLQALFSTDPAQRRTYFAGVVSGFGDICELVGDPDGLQQRCREAGLPADRDDARDDLEQYYQQQVSALLRDNDDDRERRSRFLDHLLARFGERFSDYVLLVQQLFDDGDQALSDRADFLRELPYLGRRRGSGHDLYDRENQWDSDNVSGLQRRLGRLLGFPSVRRRNLGNVFALLYEQIDEDNANDWRFRVRQAGSDGVLLSSSTRFDTREQAALVLEVALELAQDRANYDLREDLNGRFYFNIIDASGAVVARRIQFFNTEQQRETAITGLLHELRERFSREGLFVVEDLLLRPRKDADEFLPVCPGTNCSGLEDPYSWRVQVIVPAFGVRLGDSHFREFVERVIRRELPAHLLPRICFVDADRMGNFEDAWHNWLDYRASHPGSERASDRSLNRLLVALTDLHSLYPAGTLHDCVEDGDEESTLVLNRSRLGVMPADGDPPGGGA